MIVDFLHINKTISKVGIFVIFISVAFTILLYAENSYASCVCSPPAPLGSDQRALADCTGAVPDGTPCSCLQNEILHNQCFVLTSIPSPAPPPPAPGVVVPPPPPPPPPMCKIVEGGILSNLIDCVDTMMSRTIVRATENIMEKLANFVSSLCVLALIIFGFRLVFGATTNKTSESIIIVIKIALISALALQSPILLQYRDLIIGSIRVISDGLIATGINSSTVCAGDNSKSLFGAFDCVIVNVIGAPTNVGDESSGVDLKNAVFIGTILVGLLFTPVGFLVLAMVWGLLVTIILAVAQVVLIYFRTIIGISFLIMITPLILPLILFKYFDKAVERWWRFILIYSLIPIVMSAYLALFIAVMSTLGTNLTATHNETEKNSVDSGLQTHNVGFQSSEYGADEGQFQELQAVAQQKMQAQGYVGTGEVIDNSSLGNNLITQGDKAINTTNEIGFSVKRIFYADDTKIKNGFRAETEDTGVMAEIKKIGIKAYAADMLRKMSFAAILPSLSISYDSKKRFILYLFSSWILFWLLIAYLKKLPEHIELMVGTGTSSGIVGGNIIKRSTQSEKNTKNTAKAVLNKARQGVGNAVNKARKR